MSWVLLRGKGKPFPYRRTDADSPGACTGRGCCCAACRVGTPYNRAGSDSPGGGVMPLAGAAGDVEDAIPYRGAAVDSPKGVLCRRCCCAERRGRRSLPGGCGFAGGGRKPSAGAAGDVGDAIPYGGCADSPEVGPGRGCCCVEGASPFPTTGVGTDSPGVCKTGGLLRGVPGSARPTGVVRIRPAMFCVVGVCRAGTRPSWFCPGRL